MDRASTIINNIGFIPVAAKDSITNSSLCANSNTKAEIANAVRDGNILI
ncbi:MAG TPA: hypothetical protein VJ697_01105 [Nitrososphaeraceae archaeon]|nr:hypothetical protein [Nitrososphaeraceae archaeon]